MLTKILKSYGTDTNQAEQAFADDFD